MVNIYKQKLTNLQQEILRLLFMNVGNNLNPRQISKYLDVSHPAISKALPLLEKEDYIVIIKDKESNRSSVVLNNNNRRVFQLKRVDNLRVLYETGFIDHIEKELAGGTIILFGSFSRGEDTNKSDIDIAIIGRKEKNIDLENFEKIFNRKINPVFFKDWKSINKHLRDNILNGILISGGVDL